MASSYHRTRELAESAAPWLPVRDLLRRNADGDLSAADVVCALCEIVGPEDDAPALLGTDDAHLFRPVHMAPTEGWQRNDTCANCGAPARDHDQATGECP